MLKLVAFDWNGTILADTYAVFEADNESLKAIGLPPVTFGDFLKYFDVPIRNYYLALGVSEKLIDAKQNQMRDAFHIHYEKRVQKVRTRSHTNTVLNWLKKEKIPAVIISNHVTERIIKQANRLKLTHFFEEILGNQYLETPMTGRNKKQRLAAYLKQKQISPKEVLIIGDTVEEVEIAKELGIISAAITQGNVSTSRLKKAKPDYLITDLGNIINIVREINSTQ